MHAENAVSAATFVRWRIRVGMVCILVACALAAMSLRYWWPPSLEVASADFLRALAFVCASIPLAVLAKLMRFGASGDGRLHVTIMLGSAAAAVVFGAAAALI
jgi:hypothetical protein